MLASFKNYAHKDIMIKKTYGNIKIVTVTGFHYEEINKTLIIGEYARLLSQKMGFKDTITIFFRHNYTENAISKCDIKKTVKGDKLSFYITYDKSNFDFVETLSILEYVIKHKAKSLNCDIKKIEHKKPSKRVNRILSNRIYRPSVVQELKVDNDISYYVENTKYHIYCLKSDIETVKLIADKLYQINLADKEYLIVFDTKDSFYYLNINNDWKSKNISFDCDGFYMPYVVKTYPNDTFSIELSKFQSDKKTIEFKLDGNEVKPYKMI